MPFESPISFPGKYHRKTLARVGKKTYIRMLLEASFVIIKSWKQLTCPSIRKWLINRGILYTVK